MAFSIQKIKNQDSSNMNNSKENRKNLSLVLDKLKIKTPHQVMHLLPHNTIEPHIKLAKL